MEVKFFNHTFVINECEILEYRNGEYIGSLIQDNPFTINEIKNYFEWLFLKSKSMFGIQGGQRFLLF